MGKNKKNQPKKNVVPVTVATNKPVWVFALKAAIIGLIAFCVISFTDSKGYFKPDDKNDHTSKKWNAFYEFTENNNVDVLLIGNSHLYTGINPINLSEYLGATSFILAAPGTGVQDSYWALVEALKRTTPSVVVLETYSIGESNPYQLNDGSLSEQMKSFTARKDVSTKIRSTPYLFALKNYPAAWSETLRNHNYLFNNYEQIEKNKEKIGKEPERFYAHPDNKMYLGRFVTFTTGITDSLQKLYKKKGAPVDGKKQKLSSYARDNVAKIKKLCKEKGIELVFVTLPMYEKHVKNYPSWKSKFQKEIGGSHWIDMQKASMYTQIGFDTTSFENSYKGNQHMTYSGSLLATYALGEYILKSIKKPLPERAKDPKWQGYFYDEEGYFYNYSPRPGDLKNLLISGDTLLNDIPIKEFLILKTNNQSNEAILKIDFSKKGRAFYKNKKVTMIVKFNNQGQVMMARLDLVYDRFHQPQNAVIFSQAIVALDITDIVSIQCE